MSSPFGGTENTDLGTAAGTVRINYESVGSTQVLGEVEKVQSAVNKAAASAAGLAGQDLTPNIGQNASSQLSGELGRVNQMYRQWAQQQSNQPTAQLFSLAGEKTGVSAGTQGLAEKARGDLNSLSNVIQQWKATVGKDLLFNDIQMQLKPVANLADARLMGEQMGRVASEAFSRTFQPDLDAPTVPDPKSSNSPGGGERKNRESRGESGGDGESGGALREGASRLLESAGSGGEFGLSAIGGIAGIGGAASAAMTSVAALGITLHGGFERLENIDSATVKMRALGYTAQQSQALLQTSLGAVEKTRFSLDEAATTAVQALSAGIQPGQQLSQYLTTVANTAELAQTSMQDMGYVFNQAATDGHLMGDQLRDLQDKGVPVLKYLADEYGVTQQRAAEMVSAGAVDFAHFEDAMTKGTKGIADVMGNTIKGSFENLHTAISRLGATLLAPIFGNATGDASNFAKALQWVQARVDDLNGFIKENAAGLIDFWSFFGQAALVSASGVAAGVGSIIGVIGGLAKGIEWIVRGLAEFADWTGKSDLANQQRQTADGIRSFADGALGMSKNAIVAGGHLVDLTQNVRDWASEAKKSAESTNDLSNAFAAVQPKSISIIDMLEKLGIKSEAASKGVTGTVEDFHKLMLALAQAHAPSDAIDTVQKMYEEYNNGGRAAVSYSEALDKLGDSSATADDKAKALIDSMKQLGMLPNDDALANYNKTISDLTSNTNQLFNHAKALGGALVNSDATIDTSTENGQKLHESVSQVQQAMESLTATGKYKPEDVWERSSAALTNVLNKAGIFGTRADEIINKYLLPEHDFVIQMQTRNQPEVKKELADLVTQIDSAKANGKDTLEFKVGTSPAYANQLRTVLENAGAQIKSYDGGNLMTVDIPADAKEKIKKALADPTGGSAKVPTDLDLNTTQRDIIDTITGHQDALHIPTVLDLSPVLNPGSQVGPGAPGTPGPGVPQANPNGPADLNSVIGSGQWKNVGTQGTSPLLVPNNAPPLGPNNSAPPGWYWESNDPNAPKGSTVLTPLQPNASGGAPGAGSPNPPPAAPQAPPPRTVQTPLPPTGTAATQQVPAGTITPQDLGGLLGSDTNIPPPFTGLNPQIQQQDQQGRIAKPSDLPGFSQLPGGTTVPSSVGNILDVLTNQTQVEQILKDHPDVGKVLQPKIDQAEKQGKSFTEAFAAGISSSDPAVRDAITKLAQLAADGLGHSPALYGPLSGDGWTYNRGETFSSAWAQGISSSASITAVQGAVGTAAQASTDTMDSSITKWVKDLSALSSFGQHIEGFAKQVMDIGFGFANLANTVSGGKLFPKNYVTDPMIDTRPNPLGGFNPQQLDPNTNQPTTTPMPGTAPGGAAPTGIGQGRQGIANYIIQKALSQGYTREQANAILTQGVGESGLSPGISGGNQSGDEVLGIFQEKGAFARAGGIDPSQRTNAQANIDAYFNHLAAAGGPAAAGDIKSMLANVSVGGPAHPSNAGAWERATSEAAPLIAGFQPAAGGIPTATTIPGNQSNPVPLPAPGMRPDGKPLVVQPGYSMDDPSYATTTPGNHPNPGAITANPASNASRINLSGSTTNAVDAAKRAGLSLPSIYRPGLSTQGYGNPTGLPQWAIDFGAQFGLIPSTYAGGGTLHQEGYAMDFAPAPGNKDPAGSMDRFADFIQNNLASQTLELIHASGSGGTGDRRWSIAGGRDQRGVQGDSAHSGYFGYGGEGFPGHSDIGPDAHVHWATDQAPLMGGQLPPGVTQGPLSAQSDGSMAQTPSAAGGFGVNPWTSPVGAQGGVLGSLFANDPMLAALGANGGATLSQQDATKTLQHIDTLIAQQNKIVDSVEGSNKYGIQRIISPEQRQQALDAKDLSNQLGQTRTSLMQAQGLKEAPSGLEQAQTFAQGASGIASDLFQTFDAGLQAITATQNIGDTLVRGIHNTQDIENMVTDFQKYITLASKIFQTAGDITSMAGSFTGGADMGGVGAAGQGLSLIGQALGAVNTAIDLGKEAYDITTKYVGRALTSWLGFPDAADAKFLLDTKTGQLQAYTSANPLQKTTFNTLGREANPQNYSDRSNPQNQFNISMAPGASASDMMNSAMFAVKANGSGAFANAN